MKIAPKIALTDEERTVLERWSRGRSTPARLVLRSRIVLLAAEGKMNQKIAPRLRTALKTVSLWRRRFAEQRIAGIEKDAPRGGRPRTSKRMARVIVEKTTRERPANATHWSTRSMAKRAGLSQSAISRIWRAFALQPHRAETFKLSTDPLFIEKVRDVVGLYLNPPDKALVLCVDEKSGIQALDRTAPLLPMRPGQVERRTHDYSRHGTTDLFAALEVATGRVLATCQRRHRSVEFRRFLDEIDASVPSHLDVHIILDNSATHKTARIRRWLVKRPRYHLHFTPTGSSWLNLVERWFAALTEKQLRRGVHRSTRELEQAILEYIDAANAKPKPFIWTKTADQILASIARFCTRTSDSGH